MAVQNAPADTSPALSIATPARPVPVPAPLSWAWRRAALFLAGAAQLITISALTSADPLAVTWASLMLAIAPAPLAVATVPIELRTGNGRFLLTARPGSRPSRQARVVAVTLAGQARRVFGGSQTAERALTDQPGAPRRQRCVSYRRTAAGPRGVTALAGFIRPVCSAL